MGVPKTFIAGSIVYGDVDECAEGVTVTLTVKNDGKSAKTKTNNFGDFEFDGLNPGKYTVKIECAGYASKTIDVDLKTDDYLGAIALTKS